MAGRSEAWVCGRSPAETVGSNPIGDMDVCSEYCVLSRRGLCDGFDHSSRGFVPTVACLSVI